MIDHGLLINRLVKPSIGSPLEGVVSGTLFSHLWTRCHIYLCSVEVDFFLQLLNKLRRHLVDSIKVHHLLTALVDDHLHFLHFVPEELSLFSKAFHLKVLISHALMTVSQLIA
jgi:hypothetical protein